MKNKVIVFSQTSNDISLMLAKRGYLDFSFECLQDQVDFRDYCIDEMSSCDMAIAICPNDMIDSFVEEIVDEKDTISLVQEQAVKIMDGETSSELFFIPLEADFEKIFDEILPALDVKICSIFGKSANFVGEKFENLKCKIFSKTPFLHTVYFKGNVDLSDMSNFCFEGDSLSCECVKLLKEKNLTIKTAETLTGGRLISKLTCQGLTPLFKCAYVLLGDADFEKIGISTQVLQEKGIESKEVAFEIAKKMLCDCDVALSVTGFDVDAGRCYVAVGNKQQIHIFSSIFHGKREEIIENLTDFALFRLLCFLKEKC